MSSSVALNSAGKRSANAALMRAVDASGPKNCERMSLSTPTTVHPRSAKWITDCDPMRPPEPVIRATGIRGSPI